MAKSERKAFLLYYNWLSVMEIIKDPAERWKTLIALVEYSRYGVVPELDSDSAKMFFELAKPIIDNDNKKYEDRCKVNAENGAKGGRPKKETE